MQQYQAYFHSQTMSNKCTMQLSVLAYIPTCRLLSPARLSHLVRNCPTSVSQLVLRLFNALSVFHFFALGRNFTKLSGGLQQVPLRHPVKFQPDRANVLRDVRYVFSTFWLLGLTPWPKFTKGGNDLLPTQIYHPAKCRRPASIHAGDIRYKYLQANKESYKEYRIYPLHAYRRMRMTKRRKTQKSILPPERPHAAFCMA